MKTTDNFPDTGNNRNRNRSAGRAAFPLVPFMMVFGIVFAAEAFVIAIMFQVSESEKQVNNRAPVSCEQPQRPACPRP